MNQPRVLSLVWNLIRGGTEGQCARVAMEHARRGITHHVAVFRREGFFLAPVESVCGPVLHVDIQRLASARTWQSVYGLARLLRSGAYHVLHAWDADAATFGSLAAQLAGVTLVTSRRDLGQIYPPYKLRWMRYADRRAAAVVVNARAIADWRIGEGLPPSKIQQIGNILDAVEFDRLASQPLPEHVVLPEGPIIGTVARLDPEKDTATFLRAAARVASRRSDVSFVVAGDGVERPALEALARDLGLGTRVAFLGDVTCVPVLLRRFTIGALVPRSNEGLSNTILEYMAGRLPVVATDCGGNRELVDEGGCGIVAPVGDVEAVANAFATILESKDRARTMGETGRTVVERDHQPEAIACRFTDLYRRVTLKAS